MRIEFGKQHTVTSLVENGVLSINDGYRAKNSELARMGIPFACAANINNGFLFDGEDCIPADVIDKVGVKISTPDDVLLTSKGTVGRFASRLIQYASKIIILLNLAGRNWKHEQILLDQTSR